MYIVSLGDLHSVDRNVTDLEGYSSHSTTFFLNKCFFKMSLRLTMTLWFRDVVYHLKISFTQLLTNLVIIMLLHDPHLILNHMWNINVIIQYILYVYTMKNSKIALELGRTTFCLAFLSLKTILTGAWLLFLKIRSSECPNSEGPMFLNCNNTLDIPIYLQWFLFFCIFLLQLFVDH